VPNVARFSITPVKGTALQHPDEVHLDSYGVAENRRFFLIDSDGRLFTGAKAPELMQIHADYRPEREHLSLSFPDGNVAEGSTAALSDPVEVNFWGRPTFGHILEGTWALALSGFVGRSVRLVRAEHFGGGTDVRPLTLMSTASVEELSRQAGLADADGRRFRMLIELGGCEPHEEDSWEGKLLRLGESTVRVGTPVPRCLVVNKDPDTGDHTLNALRVIAQYRERSDDGQLVFGVYGDVEEPGLVRVGDTAELV
jgi:hypothetical protein